MVGIKNNTLKGSNKYKKEIPEELQPMIKDKMTYDDYAMLGTVLVKMKVSKIKDKIRLWRKKRK